MIVNTKIKKVRVSQTDLTQSEVAKQVGVSLRAYQYYENGERVPDVLTAKLIATALGSTVDELF